MRSRSWSGSQEDGANVDQLVAGGVPLAQAGRIAVRANMQVALRASFERCGGAWLCAMILLSLGFMVALLWVMWVFSEHEDEHCDEPVASILNVLIVLLFLNMFQSELVRCCLCHRSEPFERHTPAPCRVVVFRRLVFSTLVLWPPVAAVLLGQVEDCPSEIVTSLYWLVGYLTGFIVLGVFVPAFFVTAMLFLIRRGLVRLPQRGRDRGSTSSAPMDVEIVELLPALAWDAKLMEESGNKQCAICIEDFDAQQPLLQTKCQPNPHVFHTECLRGWTRASRTCPLCRSDLVTGEAPPQGGADSTDRVLLDVGDSTP